MDVLKKLEDIIKLDGRDIVICYDEEDGYFLRALERGWRLDHHLVEGQDDHASTIEEAIRNSTIQTGRKGSALEWMYTNNPKRQAFKEKYYESVG